MDQKKKTHRKLRALYVYCLDKEKPYVLEAIKPLTEGRFYMAPSVKEADVLLAVGESPQATLPELMERAGHTVHFENINYLPASAEIALAENAPRIERAFADDRRALREAPERGRGR